MDEIGNDRLGQEIECLSVAEEARDIDEQVAGEKVEFVCVAAQGLEITLHAVALDRGHRHAPLDPALQRPRLVQPEIVPRRRVQEFDDLGQPLRCAILRA